MITPTVLNTEVTMLWHFELPRSLVFVILRFKTTPIHLQNLPYPFPLFLEPMP